MQTSLIQIAGDTPGHDFHLPVLVFEGRDAEAPRTYIQAALHADELPGVAAIHKLLPHLVAAEARGDILGRITIVPKANPIGAGQYLYGEHQGRFELGSRVNFNRDYPLVTLAEAKGLLENLAALPAVDQLKRHLLSMAIDADLMLDLHCDDESLLYSYLHQDFWPAAVDLAESCGLEAVLLSDGNSTAFEDAVTHAWRNGDLGGRSAWHQGRIAITMEYRGQRDVTPELAEADALGLLSFLKRRGVVAGVPDRNHAFAGPIAGLDYVQMVNAPVAGTVLFERTIGDVVKAGEPLAVMIASPGDPAGDVAVTAPVDGTIVTRVSRRFIRRGDNLMKIASRELSHAPRKPGGGLED